MPATTAPDADVTTAPSSAPVGRRRAFVKKLGKKLFRGLDAYLGRQSLIPNEPVLPSELFDWADDFRSHWGEMRQELDELLRRRDALPRFQDLSPDQYRISPDDLWRTFVLYGFGHRSDHGCSLCPETARQLEKVPGIESAFFSILAPGKYVPLHKGVTKGMVRCHLGIKIPKRRDDCSMTVGGVRCTWEEGEVLFFDDTYPHEVTNDTDEERAVLLFDFERPMTRRGRWLSYTLLALLRRSAYFKDALENQQAFEARDRELLAEQQSDAPPPLGRA